MTEGNEKASGAAGEAGTPSETKRPVDLSQFVPLEDFRKFQSTKDREVAEERRRSEELQGRLVQLEGQYEGLIQDPVKRAEYQQQRVNTELEYYKKQAELTKQKHWFQETYGVPLEEIANVDDASQLTVKVLDWQKAQKEAAVTEVTKVEKEKASKKTEEEGGDDVSTAPGTPPTRQAFTSEQLDKRIVELRVVAQKGGSAGVKARQDILKLEAQRLRPPTSRAKV